MGNKRKSTVFNARRSGFCLFAYIFSVLVQIWKRVTHPKYTVFLGGGGALLSTADRNGGRNQIRRRQKYSGPLSHIPIFAVPWIQYVSLKNVSMHTSYSTYTVYCMYDAYAIWPPMRLTATREKGRGAINLRTGSCNSLILLHCKKINDFLVPSRDVTD